jgi:hypothetical protein
MWGAADLPHVLMLRMLERGRGWTRKASRRLLPMFRRSEASSVRAASLGNGDSGDGDALTHEGLLRVCDRLSALTSLQLALCREAAAWP